MRVNPKIIQALSMFVPKKDIRPYLLNINFELQINRTILTACNGHVLLCVCLQEENEKEDTFKLPLSSFQKTTIDYEITRGEDGKVYVTNGLVKVEVPQDEYKYPDIRRAIPTTLDVKVNGTKTYDAEYLLLFKKASKLLGGREHPVIQSNDIVDIGLSNVVGLNMPVILQQYVPVVSVSPEWLELPQK